PMKGGLMATVLVPTVLRVGEDTLHLVGHEDTWVPRYALNGGTDTLLPVIAAISEGGNGCFLARPKAPNLKDFFFKEAALRNGGQSKAAEGALVLLVGIGAGRPHNWARFAWRLKTENRQLPDGRVQGLIVALGFIKTYDDQIISYRLTGKTASIAVSTVV